MLETECLFLFHTQKMAAMNFAEGGVILAFGRYNSEVPCFDMQWFSCFDHEKEVLFFGGSSVLKICNIIKFEQMAWRSFAIDIRALQAIHSFVTGSALPSAMTFQIKDVMLMMMQSVLDRDISDVVCMSPYIKKMLYHQLYSAPNRVELDWSILLADYGFLSPILMKLQNRGLALLNITNLSNLLPLSQHFTITLPRDFMVTFEFLNSILNDVQHITERRSVTVELQWMRNKANVTDINFKSLFNPENVVISKTDNAIIVRGSFSPNIPLPTVKERETYLTPGLIIAVSDAFASKSEDPHIVKQVATIDGFIHHIFGSAGVRIPRDVRGILFDFYAIQSVDEYKEYWKQISLILQAIILLYDNDAERTNVAEKVGFAQRWQIMHELRREHRFFQEAKRPLLAARRQHPIWKKRPAKVYEHYFVQQRDKIAVLVNHYLGHMHMKRKQTHSQLNVPTEEKAFAALQKAKLQDVENEAIPGGVDELMIPARVPRKLSRHRLMKQYNALQSESVRGDSVTAARGRRRVARAPRGARSRADIVDWDLEIQHSHIDNTIGTATSISEQQVRHWRWNRIIISGAVFIGTAAVLLYLTKFSRSTHSKEVAVIKFRKE